MLILQCAPFVHAILEVLYNEGHNKGSITGRIQNEVDKSSFARQRTKKNVDCFFAFHQAHCAFEKSHLYLLKEKRSGLLVE
jgi:hypothetical protein